MDKSPVVKEHCRFCNGDTFQSQIVRPIGPHYGEQVCVSCNNRVKFLRKPKNENKRRPNKYTASSLGVNYCEMCLRDREQLVSYETLEVHHKTQISDGGPDSPGNIWILCTPCHKIVHHHRTYLRRADIEFPIRSKP